MIAATINADPKWFWEGPDRKEASGQQGNRLADNVDRDRSPLIALISSATSAADV